MVAGALLPSRGAAMLLQTLTVMSVKRLYVSPLALANAVKTTRKGINNLMFSR